jgi:hypothetical protein
MLNKNELGKQLEPRSSKMAKKIKEKLEAQEQQ